MIYPKNNRLIFYTMHFYVKWLAGRHFKEILFNSIETDKNRSVLLIANHFSFWDGIILYIVNTRLLKKKMHIMVLEKSFAAQPFFKYGGMFSVRKNSRDILASLDYAAALLNDPQNMVVIYPQGKLYANFVSHINFESGVLRIMNQATGDFQLVFAAAFIQYFRHLKPTATVYLKTENVNYAHKTLTELQTAYQQHYDTAKLLQTEMDIEAH